MKSVRQESQSEQRVVLAASGGVNQAGRFEVLAITAGSGNGWEFPEGVLRESLNLWDNTACFVDHAGFWPGRSVKDLAGVFSAPRWDPAARGICLELQTLGPSGPLVEELGRQMLSEGQDARPRVGFSADILFTASGKKVQSILRVNELCLVFDPARGGAFVRTLNSIQSSQPLLQGGTMMPETQSHPSNTETAAQAAHPANPAGSQAIEAASAVRLQMCTYLLDSGLAAARLPAPMTEHVRKQFANRLFEPAELITAIEEARSLVSQLSASTAVTGPRSISGMFSTEDQLQAAVDDLSGAPREQLASGLKTARLHGVRELYNLLTGDFDLHGGYHPERAQLATTADFTGLVKNAMNKIIVSHWEALGRAGYRWWEHIVTVEHFNSLQQITGTLMGTVGSLPSVAEGGEYTELAIGDSPETADFVKYGGYIPLTLELIDRDETHKLRAYPRELAMAGLRKISALVAAIFSANAGVGPTLADGGALFNNTAVTTAGGHKNLLTTALAAAEWEVVSAAVYNQPMLVKNAATYYGSGPKMAISPRYLCVPRALQLTAMKILYPTLENAANIYSENLQRGQPGDVIVVPEWTDANDWAALCDPLVAPAIYLGERFGLLPEIFIAGDELSPAVFMNDEHRLKVRHFLAVWVNDFRPLHKSNVVGG